ncbi:MAG: T9SS type A sorting domain-containing protein [Prevotellaceae bacterium]|jgi:hypothetical protein|nr:T9SS type A sorting domain-containing protein [Prevotellaceae bacterium]
MKRICTIILALFAFGLYASAQSVAFYKDGHILEPNAEITITEFHANDEEVEMLSGVILKNLTNQTVRVRIEQTVLERPKGVTIDDRYTGFYWCLSSCIVGWKNSSMEGVIGPNEELAAPDFHLDYHPGEYVGIAKAEYALTNLDETRGEVRSVVITYNYSQDTKVDNVSKNTDALSASYKNGALYVNYNFRDGSMYEITVNDITGKAVYRQKNAGGDEQLILPAQLNKGMYIVSVKNATKNSVSTKKFIVAN